MLQLTPYLSFNGSCRDAMTFYKECIGGDLMLQTVAETPMADKLPPQMKDSIMHSTLTNNSIVIMASDMMRSKPVFGNTITLCFNCSSEEEIRGLFFKLSSGGKVTEPLNDTFWGALFGEVTDKYGVNWMVNYDKNAKK